MTISPRWLHLVMEYFFAQENEMFSLRHSFENSPEFNAELQKSILTYMATSSLWVSNISPKRKHLAPESLLRGKIFNFEVQQGFPIYLPHKYK